MSVQPARQTVPDAADAERASRIGMARTSTSDWPRAPWSSFLQARAPSADCAAHFRKEFTGRRRSRQQRATFERASITLDVIHCWALAVRRVMLKPKVPPGDYMQLD